MQLPESAQEVRRVAARGPGYPVRYYFWRAWLGDGLVMEQIDAHGRLHHSRELPDVRLVKMAWVPFSLARARLAWAHGIPAVPSLRGGFDEAPAVELDSPDGRVILPIEVGNATMDFDRGEVRKALVAYRLEHADAAVELRPWGVVKPLRGPEYFRVQRAPVALGKHRFTSDYELKRKDG